MVWIFVSLLLVAIVFDLGLVSKKNTTITIKRALFQTAFWIALSLLFCVYLLYTNGHVIAVKYLTAYLMEWSLSIDNIFVFLLIFSFFRVKPSDAGRALLIGILLAIIFRIIFIAVGIQLIERFHWLMYFFGVFLIYTGIKLFWGKEEEEYNPEKSKIYTFCKRFLNLTTDEPNGKFFIIKKGKFFFTLLSMVVVMLGATDILFALDSIPTVVSLVRDKATVPFTAVEKLVIYSSNIFAVLGLRSLFFLLQGAVNKFQHLQQGIAIVLVFIGFKMLIENYFPIPIYLSLIFILISLLSSIGYSIYKSKQKEFDNL